MTEAAQTASLSQSGPLSSPASMARLGSLLEELQQESAAGLVPEPVIGRGVDNELALVRLGVASSLYAALAMKHPASASHSLRVALTTSAWALAAGVGEELGAAIEVAALLHDVGVIGVPDRILQKPGPLDQDEARVLDRARAMSLEILRCCCSSREVLQIVEHIGAWYDGARPGFRLTGEAIPLGARMIAIADAYDAMVTDQVFRPAMSRETALGELFTFAGTQFDPGLVRQFVELDCCDDPRRRREAATHWLRSVDPEAINAYWRRSDLPGGETAPGTDNLFVVRLLDNMHDAVVFVDAQLQVVQWNHGAERLTGIPGASVAQRQWVPGLLGMRNEKGRPIGDEDCPVTCAVRSGVQSLRRLTISGRNGRLVSVDSHTIPVVANDGSILGAVLLMHDASPEASLEERCQTLHEKATRDPLTQVANRAEFDRLHAAFVAQYKERRVPFSLIICDLDRFKQVNDHYGHQAGDDAIKSLATLLKNGARPGDLVARYGGEEFVVLCADCDNATATGRAEQFRKAFAQMPQKRMEGRVVTASFGVTEVQPGDTPETMLRRADRALLMAKGKGRNTAVQLGSGSGRGGGEKVVKGDGSRADGSRLVRDLVTPVPIQMAVEKLRGFVSDHQARVLAVDGNHVKLLIDEGAAMLRRRNDRPMAFLMELEFEEEEIQKTRREGGGSGRVPQTRIHVTVVPRKNRDRRRRDVTGRAGEVLSSFRSYLMASDAGAGSSQGVLRKAKAILTPWLTKG